VPVRGGGGGRACQQIAQDVLQSVRQPSFIELN
jgi:hypothetical protein